MTPCTSVIYCVIISLLYKKHSEQTTIRVTSNDYRFDCTPHVHTASYVALFPGLLCLYCFVTLCKQSKVEAKKALMLCFCILQSKTGGGEGLGNNITDTFFIDKNIQGQDTITAD